MSDSNVINAPNDDGESLTDSQVIPFKEAPRTISSSSETAGGNDSVFGETLPCKDELSAAEELVIQGNIEGTIKHSSSLTIGNEGNVNADIQAERVTVEGKVDGDQTATLGIIIREGGDVTGNIVAPTVRIDAGATFNGKIEMRAPKEEQRDK